MTLSTQHKALLQRAKRPSASSESRSLCDGELRYLLHRVAEDLDLCGDLTWAARGTPDFFTTLPENLTAFDQGPDPAEMFDELVGRQPESDTYLLCLSRLYHARTKYQTIHEKQPLPTFDQIGPRGLLQTGIIPDHTLFGLLVWRKWIYDLDNRAAQDTGYLFEAVLANAIGGESFTAKKSPVKRHEAPTKGRQVDCVKDDRAYEFKMRITIAASGQGRWREELDYALDCKHSGYVPVVLVLDPTANPKLTELRRAIGGAGGELYAGQDAWDHLAAQASPEMAGFIRRYVEIPLEALLAQSTVEEQLPKFSVEQLGDAIRFTVGDEEWEVQRAPSPA